MKPSSPYHTARIIAIVIFAALLALFCFGCKSEQYIHKQAYKLQSRNEPALLRWIGLEYPNRTTASETTVTPGPVVDCDSAMRALGYEWVQSNEIPEPASNSHQIAGTMSSNGLPSKSSAPSNSRQVKIPCPPSTHTVDHYIDSVAMLSMKLARDSADQAAANSRQKEIEWRDASDAWRGRCLWTWIPLAAIVLLFVAYKIFKPRIPFVG